MERFPVQAALRIAREAALGLETAHVKRVVHRDISSDNLLLVRPEHELDSTKVIDFGIAKPLSEDVRSFTATNIFIGKLEYASPEQCGLLEPGEEIDRRSDIYSLGVTLYNMVTGCLPYHCRSDIDTVRSAILVAYSRTSQLSERPQIVRLVMR